MEKIKLSELEPGDLIVIRKRPPKKDKNGNNLSQTEMFRNMRGKLVTITKIENDPSLVFQIHVERRDSCRRLYQDLISFDEINLSWGVTRNGKIYKLVKE